MKKDELIIQSIIRAAKKRMQQYGLSKTTMEDIAKEAGKGKSTLYYYFKSKEEIFDQVISEEMDEFFGSVKLAVSEQTDVVEMLKTFIVVKIKTLRNKINLYRFAIEEDFQDANRINDAFAVLRNRYDEEEKKLILFILNTGIDSKRLSDNIQFEIDLLSELLLSCVRGIEMDVITRNKYEMLPDKAGLLIDIIINGIGRKE
jgi:AcrR family transcriptional regulator